MDEHSYHYATHDSIIERATMLDHRISLHFLVNDVFMCFTFGLAVKEETEALLQAGRSRRAGALQTRCGHGGGFEAPLRAACHGGGWIPRASAHLQCLNSRFGGQSPPADRLLLDGPFGDGNADVRAVRAAAGEGRAHRD